MNKITITYDNCGFCEHCMHNGLLQNNPKFVCHHPSVLKDTKMNKSCTDFKIIRGTEKVKAKYWQQFPILGSYYAINNTSELKIPDWCPRLESEEKND